MSKLIPIADLRAFELDVFLRAFEIEEAPSTLQHGQALRKAEKVSLLSGRLGSEKVAALDVNLVSPEALTAARLSKSAQAALRARRPFLTMAEAEAIPGLSAAERRCVSRLLQVTPLRLSDGAEFEPTDRAPALHVSSSETESSGELNDIRYRLASQTEADDMAIRTLPALARDDASSPVYVDPRFIVAQFDRPVEAPEITGLLSCAGLSVFRRFDSEGLALLRIEDERHGFLALTRSLAVLNVSDLVEIAEPGWIAMDTIECAGRADDADAPQAENSGTSSALPWNLTMIGGGALGAGDRTVRIAVVDTGIDDRHPAVAHALVPPVDGERRNYDTGPPHLPNDIDGHGTAVASVLVGNGSGGVHGVAPGCGLIAIRVPLWGSLASYALRRDALLALAHRSATGERLIVNLSWRTAGDVSLVRDAIERLTAAGALVVCSAGNRGAAAGTPHFPSDYLVTMSVAALDNRGARTTYSDFGPAVDIAAPGGDNGTPIRCAQVGGGTSNHWGTSFAAPHVAAALALIWSRRPGLQPAQVRAVLEGAAHPLQDQGLGHGALSLAAISATLSDDTGPPPAPNPCNAVGTGGSFPMAGSDLAAAACDMPAITRMILSARPTVSGWDEVAAILGMTDVTLSCLRENA